MRKYNAKEKVSLIAVFQNPNDPGDFERAQPYEIFSTFNNFKNEGKKVRARLRQEGSLFEVVIKVNKSKYKPVLISTQRMLFCIREYCVEFEGDFYCTLNVLQTFLDEFATIYVCNKFGIPRQLHLPIYGNSTEGHIDDDDMGDVSYLVMEIDEDEE